LKSRLLSSFAVVALSIGLMAPAQLAAQDAGVGKQKHHHYHLIDMGTFGGPQSYFNSLNLTDAFGFGTVFYNVAQVRNARGEFVGFADTTTPDPYPAFCYVPECYVTHAFQFADGVKTDLGALPGGASSAPFWINSRGWITGNSENGETDPVIPGLPEVQPCCGKTGRFATSGRLVEARVFHRL
jgi:hypothetical protein